MANEFVTTPITPLGPGTTAYNVVRAGTPAIDGCSVLTRLKAFVVAQGVPTTLEYVFRDTAGNPVALVDPADSDVSESASTSGETSDSDAVSVTLQISEFTGVGNGSDCVHTAMGTIVDAATGTVRVTLPCKVYERAGIYTLTWTFLVNEVPLYVSSALLSVERNLLAPRRHLGEGPPTLQEIRMAIMDSGAAENVLLDRVEFDDEQILLAIVKPLQYFNETNPPIDFIASTHNFPWREHLIIGILAQLHLIAAANYRRNVLMVNTGGLTIADKAKEKEYLTAWKLYDEQWKAFVLSKKCNLNMRAGFGSIGSSYG